MSATLDDERFISPRMHLPVDLEAHLRRLPPDASCRGVYLNNIVKLAAERGAERALFARSGVEPRTWIPFTSYPERDFLRLLYSAGEILTPSVEPGERIRRLGRHTYESLLSIQLGRTLFGSLGSQFDLVSRLATRAWAISLNFGRVEYEERGQRHFRFHFTDMPAFLETFQVGVVEGAMKLCNVRGVVKVHPIDISTLSMDVRWLENAT